MVNLLLNKLYRGEMMRFLLGGIKDYKSLQRREIEKEKHEEIMFRGTR